MKKITISIPMSRPLAAMLIAAFIAFSCGGDKTPWLWKIEGKPVTLKQLDEYYGGFAFMMRQQLQSTMRKFLTEEEFAGMLEDPDKVGIPQLAEQLREFGKDNFSKQLKDLLVLNMEAQKDGYAKRPDVKAKLEFITKFNLANMYLFDQLKVQDIKVSEAEVHAAWQEAKKKDARLATIPIDQGLDMIKGQMVTNQVVRKQGEFMENAKQKYRIENNKDFDIAEYVKNQREAARKKREEAATPGGGTPSNQGAPTPGATPAPGK